MAEATESAGTPDGRDMGRATPEAMRESARVTAASTKQRAKERRLAERGDRILDALAALMTRWGYAKTTVDDIAREAGVAKGTVYLHWPTKEAMLLALIDREARQWNAIIAERMADDPHGGTISNMYRHALALCVENPVLRAIFTLDNGVLGEWTRLPESRERAYQTTVARHALITALRDAGLMRTDMSVEVQAYLLAALSYGILAVDEYIPAEFVPPLTDVVDAFAVLVRRGLETESADGDDARGRGAAAIADLMNSVEAMRSAPGQAPRGSDPAATGADDQGAARPGSKEYTT